MLSVADEEFIRNHQTSTSLIIDRQRIKTADGEDYIDEFGRYVYIACRIGATLEDIDYRYTSNNFETDDIFQLQHIEDDIRNRQTHTAFVTGSV